MTGLFKFNRISSAVLALGVFAGALAIVPTSVRADDHRRDDDRRYDRDRDRHDHDKTDVKVDINFGSKPRPRYTERRVRYWVEPEYRVVTERVYVEPVYKVVTQRIWIEPVYKTVYEEVQSPARYEIREVTRRIGGPVSVTTRERVLVEPACTRRIAHEVLVSEGRWDVVEKRICVSEGRWNNVERYVCVSDGRWDYRVERVEFDRDTETRIDFRF